jgi:hypothetical protein
MHTKFYSEILRRMGRWGREVKVKLRFVVFTGVTIKTTNFRDVKPSSLVGADLDIEAVPSSETSVNLYLSTGLHIPEDNIHLM